MTIIFEFGGNFWIETVALSCVMGTDEEEVNSALVNLERPGHFVGGSLSGIFGPAGDAPNEMGMTELRDQSGNQIAYGAQITGIIARCSKASGFQSGTLIFTALIFMRKNGLPS